MWAEKKCCLTSAEKKRAESHPDTEFFSPTMDQKNHVQLKYARWQLASMSRYANANRMKNKSKKNDKNIYFQQMQILPNHETVQSGFRGKLYLFLMSSVVSLQSSTDDNQVI